MKVKVSLKKSVLNLTKRIPFGKITTYKIISQLIFKNNFGARAVGSALKKCPCKKKLKDDKSSWKNYNCRNYCYRVIKTNSHIGKFVLEKQQLDIDFSFLKKKKLAEEKITFYENGFIKNNFQSLIFKNFSTKKTTSKFCSFNSNAVNLAKKLLNKILVRKIRDNFYKFKIIETEAYMGPKDDASHSYNNKLTKRTWPMFEKGGTIYVYLVYGINFCFNVVANQKNKPEAVLIRALEQIQENKKKLPLTNGPGKLCKVLEISKKLNGLNLINNNEIWIENNKELSNDKIVSSERINIDYAEKFKNKKWRFYIKDNSFISKK